MIKEKGEKMVENNEKEIEFTILMPCLNEENTIGICIEKAQKFLKENTEIIRLLKTRLLSALRGTGTAVMM